MPSSTKTKTKNESPTIDQHISAAEEAHRKLYEEITQQVTELSLSLLELEQAAEEAEYAPEEVEQRWRAGEDVPAAEYAEAQAAKAKADAMFAGAKVRLSNLERKLKGCDKTLAEAVKPIIQKAMPHVPVLCTFVKVTERVALEERPVVILQQVEPTHRSKEGHLSGKLTVLYFRSGVHRDLNGRNFEHAARARGFNLSSGQVRTTVTGEDSLVLTVNRAYEAEPAILNIDPLAPSRLAQRVLQTMAGAVRYEGHGVALNGRTSASGSHFDVTQRQDLSLDESVDDDGTRSVTFSLPLVKVQTKVQPSGSRSVSELIVDALERELMDSFVPGLGVIAEVSFRPSGTHSKQASWSAVESPDYRVDLTIRSRVA